jgi:AGCS family alanine or glycine:cation symporter
VAQSFGVGGQWFMTIVVFAFCFSSVLGNYAYADANLTFLGAGPKSFFWFRIVAIAAVLLGSITALPLVWAIADVAMGLMTLVNVAAIVMLSRWVVLVLADYERSLEASREPVFSGKAVGMPALPADSNW